MNEFGKGLLENSICYIAKFTGARPIGRIYQSSRPDWMRARYISDRLVLHGDPGKWIDSLFAPVVAAHYDAEKPEAFRAWYRQNRGYLYAAPDSRIVERLVAALRRLGRLPGADKRRGIQRRTRPARPGPAAARGIAGSGHEPSQRAGTR